MLGFMLRVRVSVRVKIKVRVSSIFYHIEGLQVWSAGPHFTSGHQNSIKIGMGLGNC